MDSTIWERMMTTRMMAMKGTLPHPLHLHHLLPHLRRIIEEEAPMEMVPEQEAPVAHEVILADAELELP
jgi:hypothetical protein